MDLRHLCLPAGHSCSGRRCADFYFAENYEHSYGLLLLEKGGFLKR